MDKKLEEKLGPLKQGEVSLVKSEKLTEILKKRNRVKLDIKELRARRWLKEYLECGNATEAVMRVHNLKNRNTAKAIGSSYLNTLNFSDLLEEGGITDTKLSKVLNDGLAAINQGPTGKEKIDYPTRHKYLETALRLKGRLVDRQELDVREYSINLDI